MRRLIKILFADKGWLLILLMGFISLMWFKEDLLIAGGDEYVLLNPGVFTNFFKYAWNIKLPNAGGVVFSIPRLIPMLYFWTFFQSLGLSLVTIEKLWAVLLFVLPGLSMYYFMSKIYNKIWAKIIASTLYMFNPLLVVAGPFQGNIKPVLIALPLMLAFFLKGLSNKKESFLKYSVLIGLCSLFYAGSNVNLPTVAIIPFTLFLYWLFHFVVERKELFRTFKFALATVGCYLFLNLWWIVNFLTDVIQKASVVREVATFSAVGTTGMVDFFRLLGCWAWRMVHYKMPYFPYAHFYDEPFLLLLSFFIPLLAFLAIFLKPKDKNICFFGFLAVIGLFLAKGSVAPFGFLYKWIWENIPGFWMFREPFSKFTPITLLAYSVLLGFSVDLLYQKTRNWLIPIITIIIIFIVAYPLLTGEVIWDKWNGSMRSFRVKIPQYWQDLKEYIINHNLEEERLLTFPASSYGMAYNWQHGFSSADDAAVCLLPNPTIRNSSFLFDKSNLVVNQLFGKLTDRNFNLKSYLSLLNTQYILQENDVDWRYSDGGMLPPTRSNKALQGFGMTKVAEFGKFTPDYLSKIPNDEPDEGLHTELYKELANQPALILYQMDDKYLLPHFYIPQNIIYSDNDIEVLPDIVSFGDNEIRSGIYLVGNVNNTDEKLLTLVERADEVFVEAELENAVDKSYFENFEKKESFKKSAPFPYVKHKPGSFGWGLARLKERYYEWRARKDAEKLIEKKLFYAGKRISEGEKWGGEKETERLILKDYQEKMEEVIGEVEKLKNSASAEIGKEMAIKLRAYWEGHKERIEEIRGLENWKKVFEKLDEKIKPLEKKFDLRNLEYEFEIPREGKYETYLGRVETEKLENWEIEIEGEGVNLKEVETREDGWISLGKKNFQEGKHQLVLHLPEPENLVGKEWQKLKLVETIEEGITLSPQRLFPQEQNVISQPIRDWQRDNLYYLAFDHKTEEGRLGVGVLEEVTVYQEEKETVERKKFFDQLLRSKEGKEEKFETILRAKSHTLGARVFLYALADPGQLAKIDFENLRINRIVQPEFLLRNTKIQAPIPEPQMPKITFVKINPTKYRVKVEGVKEPYTLVFSESFHKGWKAYINGIQNDYGKIVASYFDGEIKEGTHRNTFLEKATFETWGKEPISEDRHLLVNSYANSWYITPEDSNGREDYELIIEFWPQRLFYIGLFISGITLIGCFSYLLYGWMQRRKVARNS